MESLATLMTRPVRTRRGTRTTALLILSLTSMASFWILVSTGHLFSPIPLRSFSLAPTRRPWRVQPNGKISITIDEDGKLYETGTTRRITRHPISELMKDGEKRWKALLKRQSTTFDQAVIEYKRRYNRMPPKGFDVWFAFAKRKGVKIIDDYDQIYSDMEIYWALPPSILQQIREKQKLEKDFWPMEFSGGVLNASQPEGRFLGRVAETIELVSGFAELMPDMWLRLGPADTGRYIMREDARQRVAEVIADDEYLTQVEVKYFEKKFSIPEKSLARHCPEESSLKHQESGFTPKQVRPNGTLEFIVDVRRTYDFCNNPELLEHHGQLVSNSVARDSRWEPVLLSSKWLRGTELLMPAVSGFGDCPRPEDVPLWSSRTTSKLFWRGSTTGNHFNIDHWRKSHRIALHFLLNQDDGLADVLVEDGHGGLSVQTIPKPILSEKYMDVGLVPPLIQCDQRDGTCEAMEREIKWKDRVEKGKATLYKYALDVDGNGWSQRYRKLLGSGVLVLKATAFPEWNTDWLIPYYHFVPIQMDYSDLYTAMHYFVGAPDGTGGHDKEAEWISRNALKFVHEHWRWEDMQAYMFRLLLEYHRLASPDREAMTLRV